jgi:glycosyltransferase involved in cell wall biosynthesis
VHDERENLAPLLAQIVAALSPLEASGQWPFEVLLVDDASTDGSWEELLRLRESEPRLRVLRGSRRQGQSAALAAGIRAARGTVIATLDCDLQNDPADIPALLRRLEEGGGADLVLGVRQKRRDSGLKRLSSRVANAARRRALGDGLNDAGCGLRAGRAELLRELPAFNGLHRFLGTLLVKRGARVVEVPVAHRPREHGRTKYGLHDRLWRGLFDLVGVRWLARRSVDLRAIAEAPIVGERSAVRQERRTGDRGAQLEG